MDPISALAGFALAVAGYAGLKALKWATTRPAEQAESEDHYAIPEAADPSVDEVVALVPDEGLELELLDLYFAMSEASHDMPFRDLTKMSWREIKTPDGKAWKLHPLWPKGSWVYNDDGQAIRKPDAKPYAAILSHRTDDAYKPERLTRVEFQATYGYDPMHTLNLQLRTLLARKEARVIAKEVHRATA